MDQFGVLVESTGFKSQRSAPMASLKPKQKTNLSFNSGFPQSLFHDSSVDGLDGIFQAKKHNTTDNNIDNGIDIFGGTGNVDLESVFGFSNKQDHKLPTPKVADDLNNLIPDLVDINGIQPEAYPSHTSSSVASTSTFSEANDPFSIFEASKPRENSSGRTSLESSLDELENFARGKVPGAATDKPSDATLTGIRISLNKKDGKATNNSFVSKVRRPEENQRENDKHKVTNKKNEAFVHDSIPDILFGTGNVSNHADLHKTQTKDPIFEAPFSKKAEPKLQKAASQPSYNIKKPSTVSVMDEGFHSLFGDAPSSAFQEVEGESEERRRARLNQHLRTQERMAKALAEKNERDYQTQYEQEERRRIAEGLDYDIKRWSAGKEGNLLALLSSLQDVLWPECGWQPVSLTDLIAPSSVKKVYHRATLCVHPDKVQQKGSSLQQKYIAEKVFDLLKILEISLLEVVESYGLIPDCVGLNIIANIMTGSLEQAQFSGTTVELQRALLNCFIVNKQAAASRVKVQDSDARMRV